MVDPSKYKKFMAWNLFLVQWDSFPGSSEFKNCTYGIEISPLHMYCKGSSFLTTNRKASFPTNRPQEMVLDCRESIAKHGLREYSNMVLSNQTNPRKSNQMKLQPWIFQTRFYSNQDQIYNKENKETINSSHNHLLNRLKPPRLTQIH